VMGVTMGLSNASLFIEILEFLIWVWITTCKNAGDVKPMSIWVTSKEPYPSSS
jgi:hypothetical protein